MVDIEAAWTEFMENGDFDNIDVKSESPLDDDTIPKASELYISTKTKIIYLNNPIELNEAFWELNILPYSNREEGIVKKQIKIISACDEELNNIQEKLKNYSYSTQHVITHLDKQQSNSKVYKDVRKLSIGISQKDLLSYRCKQKSAFYNCFVIIVRLFCPHEKTFKEVHAKIFNTGKIEIPGIQNEILFNQTCNFIVNRLNQLNRSNDSQYEIDTTKTETILINSNFHCGFCINRQNLFNILRRKYNLNVSYDPCSYPGIQCKYSIENCVISFMVFRTGSVLIVGKCDDSIIYKVYNYLKNILESEYKDIREQYEVPAKQKERKQKVRKKTIYVNH